MKKIILIIFLGLIIFGYWGNFVFAQDQEILEGQVTKILEEKQISFGETQEKQLFQKLEILVTAGSLKDKKIEVESGNLPMANLPKYKVGDKLLVAYSLDLEGNDSFQITDYIRRDSLSFLFSVFVILAILIAGWRGITSLVGMAVSFLVIFIFVLPKILAGSNPVLIAVLGSFLIIPVSFYLSHGLNKKTTVAVVGTILALAITGILAGFFVDQAKLTGFASEEAGFLQVAKQGTVNIKGLLLAGIIIGVLGVLDDITISQSAIVFQLKQANPKLKKGQLFWQAMNVGQDHIASMVNTLILVYTGAALPLLLLFINTPHPFSEVINYEIVAEEVVRTLVGSIGLILAVPITTFIASVIANENK